MTYHRYRNPNPKPRGGLRQWAYGLAFVALAMSLVYTQFQKSLPNKIRSEIQNKLNHELRPFGLVASLRNAEFLDGKGFRLVDLLIRQSTSSNPQPIISIHSVFLHSPTQLHQLATGDVKITAVDINAANLTAVRFHDGSWQLAPLLRHLSSKCDQKPDQAMKLRLQNSAVQIVLDSTSSQKIHSVRDVNLVVKPIVHENRKLVQIDGNCSGLSVSRLNYRAFVDPGQKVYFAEFNAENAQLTTGLFGLLPESTAGIFDDVETLGGQLNLRGTANGTMNDVTSSRFEVAGKLSNFSLNDRRVPLPIKSCDIDFEVSNDGFEIRRAVGQAGEGTFDISYRQQGLLRRGVWSSEGKVTNFNFTERIRPWLPNSCQTFCDDFKPSGTSNVDYEIAFDGQKFTKNIQSQITNMQFNFVKFPYPFRGCRGRVSWINDDCQFDIHSQIGRQPVRMSGQAIRPGSQSTYVIDLEAQDSFTIDEKLLAALEPYPGLKRQVLAFHPNGSVSGIGRIVKSKPNITEPDKSFDIRLHDCHVRHASFQYPIGSVNGLVRVRNQNCNFENVTGSNGSAMVRCDGAWDSQTGLALRFLCRQVPFDESLRRALRPSIQEIWNGLRPRGTIGDMRVLMNLPLGAEFADLYVEADLAGNQQSKSGQVANLPTSSSVSIFPTWFPYEINELTGKVQIGGGRINLANLHGKHRRAWISCQGQGVYSTDGWSVSLKDMLIGAVETDEDLLQALPKTLSGPLRRIDFQGIVNVQGEITMGGRHASPTPERLQQPPPLIAQTSFESPEERGATNLFWDLRLNMDQANMNLGFPVENVFGMIQLNGEYDGVTGKCAGELAIDSLMLHGAQIRNLNGPIWIDENGIYAGTFAPSHQQSQPRQLVGEAFEGQLRLDAKKLADEDGRFLLQASLTEASLKEMVSDFAPRLTDVSGKGYGAVRITGDETSTHSLRGEGTFQLRDARIYELPLVVSLLKILRIKEVNRTAFDASSIDFGINGQNIEFDRIELIGDAISLIGNGQIDFNRQLELNFYSIVGRNRIYIPMVSELYRAGSQSILWITVDGTLEEPNTSREILPQLNDTIRTLLQPPERRNQFGPNSAVGLPFTPLNSPIGTNAFPLRR